MTRAILAALTLGILATHGGCTGIMAADVPPTTEQISACLADALRLCDIKTIDRAKIKACLLSHRTQLSTECRSAFK